MGVSGIQCFSFDLMESVRTVLAGFCEISAGEIEVDRCYCIKVMWMIEFVYFVWKFVKLAAGGLG